MEKLTNAPLIVISKKGQHVKLAVMLGRCIPASKSMLRHWSWLDILGQPDVEFIKSVLPEARFKLTKSKMFARLDDRDFPALKLEITKKIVQK